MEAAAAAATDDAWRGVDASEGTRRGGGEEVEEAEAAEAAAEAAIECLGDDEEGIAAKLRRFNGAATCAALPGNGEEQEAKLARRGAAVSLRAILTVGTRREIQKKREREESTVRSRSKKTVVFSKQ